MNIIGIYGAFDWNANTCFDSETDHLGWVHDSGATLFLNGIHVCSISEERLSRIKYDGNFPQKSIDYCLSYGNVKNTDIDFVCIPSMCNDIFFKRMTEKFIELSQKGRTLISPLPAYSTHCHDLFVSPCIDWKKYI